MREYTRLLRAAYDDSRYYEMVTYSCAIISISTNLPLSPPLSCALLAARLADCADSGTQSYGQDHSEGCHLSVRGR